MLWHCNVATVHMYRFQKNMKCVAFKKIHTLALYTCLYNDCSISKKTSALKSAIETIYIQEEMEKSQATIIVAFFTLNKPSKKLLQLVGRSFVFVSEGKLLQEEGKLGKSKGRFQNSN